MMRETERMHVQISYRGSRESEDRDGNDTEENCRARSLDTREIGTTPTKPAQAKVEPRSDTEMELLFLHSIQVTLPGVKHLIINKPPDLMNGQGIKMSRMHKIPEKFKPAGGNYNNFGKRTVTTATELGGKLHMTMWTQVC